MAAKQGRPDVGFRTALEAIHDAETSIPNAADRPRCCACGHPLNHPRSLARGYGRTCWRRTARAQLDARRDYAGRLLVSLARSVAVLDGVGLDLVVVALLDLEDAIAEGVAR